MRSEDGGVRKRLLSAFADRLRAKGGDPTETGSQTGCREEEDP